MAAADPRTTSGCIILSIDAVHNEAVARDLSTLCDEDDAVDGALFLFKPNTVLVLLGR